MDRVLSRLITALLMTAFVTMAAGCSSQPAIQSQPGPIPADPFTTFVLDNILQEAEELVSQVPSLEEYLDYLNSPDKGLSE